MKAREIGTKTTLLLYKSRLFGQNERCKWTFRILLPGKKKKKKKKEKHGGYMIKCLLTELGRAGRENIWPSAMAPWPRAKYFPVRPSHSVNKYILSHLVRLDQIVLHVHQRIWKFADTTAHAHLNLQCIKKFSLWRRYLKISGNVWTQAIFENLWIQKISDTCGRGLNHHRSIPSSLIQLYIINISKFIQCDLILQVIPCFRICHDRRGQNTEPYSTEHQM